MESNRYSEKKLNFRRQTLSILFNNFNDNKAIYECADDWTSKFTTTSGLIQYYKTYYDK